MSLLEDRKAAREKAKLEAAYAKQLEARSANVARNIAEGRNLGVSAGDKPLNFPKKDVAESLSDLKNKMQQKGNLIQKAADTVKTAEGAEPKLLTLASRFPKLKAMLALAGPAALAAGAFGIGEQAMAGDIKGALGNTADIATDYLPGIGEAKMALSSSPLGEHSDEIAGEEPFDFSKYKTNPAINDSNVKLEELASSQQKPIMPPEGATRFKDLTQTLGDAMDRERRRGQVKKQQNY